MFTAIVILGFFSSPSFARSYGFLNEAIREHSENPTSKTQARLTAAQNKAMIFDFSIIAVPAGLIGYVLFRGFKKRQK